nr:response regulator [uncultured Dyadobacter sp.]
MHTHYNVLVVDDDEDDQFLIRQAFEDDAKLFSTSFCHRWHRCAGKIKAPKRLPDLILLDLNMPKMSGFDVLTHLKGSEEYRHIPVIIFSTSQIRQTWRKPIS